MLSPTEQILQKACQEREIPNAVLVAGDQTGQFQYTKAFGVRSLASNHPIQKDATMWMASCTKLVTTIAAVQCVERGLLNLDADVTTILPELKNLSILQGFDDKNGGKPILIPSTKEITLRHLLTHASGLSYDIFSPSLIRYHEYLSKETPSNKRSSKLIRDKYVFPLLFEPGEGWEYGVGIDWAGQMVERVNNISLEEYFRTNIWQPLNITDMTFKPYNNALVEKNLTEMSLRQGDVTQYGTPKNPDAELEASSLQNFWDNTSDSDDCYGGSGMFGSMLSYQLILNALLSTPSPLLSPSSIDEMFTPQLSKASKAAFAQLLTIPEVNIVFGSLDADAAADADWGLGGMMNMRDLKSSGRKSGSLAWGGFPGLVWWADRKTGLAGIWGSQLCPPGDPKIAKLERVWERWIYDVVLEKRKEGNKDGSVGKKGKL